MASSPPRILLTGARGQVGLRCLHYWLEAGAEVIALTRKAPPEQVHPHLTWVQGDLARPESIQLPTPFPDTVIFTAPIWFLPPLMPRFIAEGVKRVIAFSSTSVHTKQHSGKAQERALAERLQVSEHALFHAGIKHDIAVTILRPTLVYGIGMDKNVTSLAHAMRWLPVLPVPLKARGLRQPVHTDDLAIATVQVAANPATFGNVYDLGGAERLTYRAMLSRIAKKMRRPILFLPLPGFAWMLDLAGRWTGHPQRIHGEIARRMQQDMVFDDSPARRDFGWKPRPFLDSAGQPEDFPFF